MGKSKDKHAKSDNFNIRKFIIYIIEIILVIAMIFAGYKIIVWINENNKSKEMLNEIASKVTIQNDNNNNEKDNKKYVVDFTGLKEKNEDTIAWVKVENMRIEYPVVKGNDNSYYLSRSFDKSYNSAGWVFMDYRNKGNGKDKNIILYGHNRKDGSMFGDLKDIFTEEWYLNEDNKYITFITENEYCKYKIFSAYRIEDEAYYITTDFKDENEFSNFVRKIKSRSFRNFEVDVSEKDQILTLSTCSSGNFRVVVHAKKIVNE